MTVLPRISALAITDVDVAVSQSDALALLGLHGDEFAEGVLERAAVSTRNLDLSEATLASTLQGRTATTEDRLFDYAVDAVRQLALDPAEVGTVVTSSLYSLGGPTLAHRLVERFEMNRSTDKYHVVGVGCASAVPLVRLVPPWLDHQPGNGSRAGISSCLLTISSPAPHAASRAHRSRSANRQLTRPPAGPGPTRTAEPITAMRSPTMKAPNRALAPRPCEVDDCERPSHLRARGFCGVHYEPAGHTNANPYPSDCRGLPLCSPPPYGPRLGNSPRGGGLPRGDAPLSSTSLFDRTCSRSRQSVWI